MGWRGDDCSRYRGSGVRRYALFHIFFGLLSSLIATAGGDTVHSILTTFHAENSQFWRYRQSRPFSRFSWQWQCTLQFRKEPRQKLMLSLGPVVYQTSVTVALFPILTHSWKNLCVGNLLFLSVSLSLHLEVRLWYLAIAVPHMASEDDEYNGYFIPKGTVVLGNAW